MVKWYHNKDGFWVPRVQDPPRRIPSRGPLDFTAVTLYYRQVYGEEATWASLQKELTPYSLEQIVIVICRISVSPYKQILPWDTKTQLRICKGIFGEEEFPRILDALKNVEARMKRENDQAPILAFHEQQILNLLKVALLFKTIDNTETSEVWLVLVKPFLMITDLLEGDLVI